MAHTQRTRVLNLASLELRPPDNLTVVHTTLIGAVNDIQSDLSKMEKAFYGEGKTVNEEIRKWVVPVNSVLRAMRLPYFNSAGQIDDIIAYIMEPSNKHQVSVYDVKRLQECLKKVMDTVPTKFKKIIQDLHRVSRQLEKYCLSFYDDQSSVYLDTAHNYERQRQDYIQHINKNVQRISALAEKFNGPGISMTDFSHYAREMARKTDCKNMPFLLFFPEACEDTRNVCSIIISWLAADANYATFLANDIIDLDQRKHELLKTTRELQHKFHKMSFRLKHLQSEHNKLGVDTGKLNEREDELIVDEERLAGETNEIQVEIEMKEYRRDEIMKKATSMQTNVLYDKYSEISESLRALKMRLPPLKRQLAAARHKLNFIKDKKKEIEDTEKELKTLEEDMIELEVAKFTKERDLKNMSRCLDFARQLHLYKNSSDAVSKIFHDQPVDPNSHRLPGKKGKEDPFERVCHLVASEIEHDWPRLYRHLPFLPHRGYNTIDRDIEQLGLAESRLGQKITALRSLSRWRRFHTMAKIKDIKQALESTCRFDILRLVEELLTPHVKEVPPSEDSASCMKEGIYATIDPYLLPYLRQVERYDEMRTANKI